MTTVNVSVPGMENSVVSVLPETVEQAKVMGLDVDLAVSCGCLWLLHAKMAKALSTSSEGIVERLVQAGMLQPLKASMILERYLAMTPGERHEFRDMLIKHLKEEKQ